jgi:5-methylthioadenosine/S-adenosylhomocysteine deaminase
MSPLQPFSVYDLAITGGYCLTLDSGFTEIPDCLILVKDGCISYLGDPAGYQGCYMAEKTIQAKGKFIMPAFFNAHTHLSLSLYRGIGTDLKLHDWLRKVIWPLERQFCTPENVYLGSSLSLLEMIKSGTGILADMNFFSGYAAKAIEESGLRGFIGEALFSTPTPSIPNPQDGFNIFESLAEQYKGHPLIKLYLVLHAPFTCSAELYSRAAIKGKEWGIKVCSHLSETKEEVQQIRSLYGKSPVQWIDSTGVIDQDFIAIHAVHISKEDIDLLAERKAGIIHCPHSNMMLGSGVSPVPELTGRGIRVGIGTDSASSNNSLSVLSELQTAARLHKLDRLDPKALPAKQALQMATSVNADIFGLSGITGTLKEDYSADLIIINPDTPNMVPMHDHYSQIVYSMENRNIASLVVHGKVVMEDRKILTLDEEIILKEVNKWMQSSSVFDFINL